jgi:hypothetical protein
MFEKLFMVSLTGLCAYGLLDLMLPDFVALIQFNKHFIVFNSAVLISYLSYKMC